MSSYRVDMKNVGSHLILKNSKLIKTDETLKISPNKETFILETFFDLL